MAGSGFQELSPAGRRRVIALTTVMLLVAFSVGVTATISHYTTRFQQAREGLAAFTKGQARLIEVLASNVHLTLGPDASSADVLDRTVSLLANRPEPFGYSAEIIVARQAGDGVRRLILQPQAGIDPAWATIEPATGGGSTALIRRALDGHSGTFVGLDHRGVDVLAAYEPIPGFAGGVVAKRDLAEIRRPLVASITKTLVASLLLVGLGLFLFVRTITPLLRRTETDESRLRGILANAVEGIVTFKAGGEIIEFNTAAERMFGRDAGSVSRHPFVALLHPGSRSTFNQWLRSVDSDRPAPPVSRQELSGLRHDGRQFPLELSLSASRSEGRPVWTAIVNDITLRRQAENALIGAKSELAHQVDERTVELQQGNRLLQAVSEVQAGFFARQPVQDAFQHMLHHLLVLTASPVGFIAEIKGEGVPICYRATWDELVESGRRTPLDFNSTAPLWERSQQTRRPFVAEGPDLDSLKGFDSLLILPVSHGDRLMGIAAVANGELPFAGELIRYVEPYLGACGTLIHEQYLRQEAERARQRASVAEKELQGIVDHVQDVIFRTDMEGRITWVSPSVIAFTGRTAEAMIGQSVAAHVTEPGGFRRLLGTLESSAGKVQDFETRLAHLDGREIWISTNCQYLHDPNGEVIGIEGVTRDVTAYKEAQQRAEILGRLYRMLGHGNRAVVHLTDKEAFYRELCRIIVDIGGFRMAWIGELDAGGTHVVPVISAGAEEGYLKALQNLPIDETPRGNGPVALSLKGERVVVVNDIGSDPLMAPWREAALARGYRSVAIFPFRREDRPFGSLNVYAETDDYFSDENVELLQALSEDISHALDVFDTERKRSEAVEHLSAVNEKLSRHIEHTPLAVIEFDNDFRIGAWNPGAENVFGYSAKEAIGRDAAMIVAPEDRGAVDGVFQKLLCGETGQKHVNDNLTRDGRRITCEWYNTVLRSADGRITGVMSLAHDITDEVRYRSQLANLNVTLEKRVVERTRELEAVNRELEAFSYSVSHDLRAPLRSIDGFSQLVLRRYAEVLDEPGRDYLGRIRSATQRMGMLIDDLLRLSRVTRCDLSLETLDLSVIGEGIVAELRQTEPERLIEIHIEPELKARGDAHLLCIALENLIGNAWKFTRHQEAPVIELGRLERDGRTSFFVRDNGAGFDMAYAHKLFGAFQRLHSEDQFEGTGIGLATVQRIIHRLGGLVWAEGKPGEGAIFHFTLSSGREDIDSYFDPGATR